MCVALIHFGEFLVAFVAQFGNKNRNATLIIIDSAPVRGHFAAVQCPMQWCETDLHDCKRVLQWCEVKMHG